MSNIQNFYETIWNNIKSCNNTFYVDNSNLKKSYISLSNDIQKAAKIFSNKKNQLTVILAKKNYDHYCSIITTILTGNTWVPLSLENPIERNIKIIKDLKPKLFLTDQDLSSDTIRVLKNLKIKIHYFQDLKSNKETKKKVILDFNFKDTEIPMIYYTSGSSGIPKGVKISHQNLSTSVYRIYPLLKISEEVWGDYHDLSFVISIPILFVCIYSKGTIYCTSNKLEEFMPCESIIKNKISCLITVPSTLERISKSENFRKIFSSLKTIVSCGEPLPVDLMNLYVQKKDTNFFNFYGSTEVSPWILFHECTKEDVKKFKNYGFAPIGKVIDGNEIKVTNQNLLLVRGSQVTPGYIGTDENSHLLEFKGKKWFSMGDVVEKKDDLFICKGRIDNQIKLNGYRIHLMDIETQIKTNNFIEDCLCAIDHTNKQKIIIAILISEAEINILELRKFLENKLPNYMIPRRVVSVRKKPINKNGKLDRKKLKDIAFKLMNNKKQSL